MLHFETLPTGTLGLLKDFTALPALQQFSLVGGTALALRFGHRRSIDFDFFTPAPFDVESLADTLSRDRGHSRIIRLSICVENKVSWQTWRSSRPGFVLRGAII